MAKTVCKLFGLVLLLVGLVGFAKADLLGMHLTTLHNIVHIATGLIALYLGFSGSYAAARTFCLVFGVIYLLLGVVGFLAPNVVASLIGMNMGGENLTPDNIVHVLLGVVFLAVGAGKPPALVRA